MGAAEVVNSILAVVEFLIIIPGLWVAGKLVPRLIGWIHPPRLREQLSRPFPRLVLWLALSSLLIYPLLDFLGLIENWQVLVSPPAGSINTSFGSIPAGSINQFSVGMMLLIYLVVWWAARRSLTRPEALGEAEWSLLILTVASLIYRFVSRGILGFLQLPLPASFGSQTNLAVVVALALLAVIVVGMNMALEEKDEG
jgi:hypothetical protein